MQYQRISADCHLDMLWLPPELFTSNASSKLRDLMPYVAENSDGVKRWTDNNGAEYGLCGGVGATGTPWVPGKQLRADKMAEAGLYSDYFEKGLTGVQATRICASRTWTATASTPRSSTASWPPAPR